VGDPIYSMFCSRVWISGSVDQMALFLVPSNPRWRLSLIFAACTLCIGENLQRHHMVSLRQHGFLVFKKTTPFFALVHYR